MPLVGIVGLGNMGRAIAERLVETDNALVVWNRTGGKAAGLEHTRVAETPASVVSLADITLSVLANDAATQDVYFGAGGILDADLNGKVIVEMCTMAPERSKELAAAVESSGAQYLECPVGGTIGPARDGQLLGLAGGSPAAFSAAKPVLGQLTRRLEHFGPVGTGAAMKLAINLPLMVYWSALGEATRLAVSHGVDPADALDVMADSSGAIGAAKKRVPPIRDMIVNGDPGGTNFSLENAIKDMNLMVHTAAAQGIDANVVAAALDRSSEAMKAGFAGLDCSLVAALGLTQTD